MCIAWPISVSCVWILILTVKLTEVASNGIMQHCAVNLGRMESCLKVNFPMKIFAIAGPDIVKSSHNLSGYLELNSLFAMECVSRTMRCDSCERL